MKTVLCDGCGCIVPIDRYEEDILISEDEIKNYNINDKIPVIMEHRIEDGIHHVIKKIDDDNILSKHKCMYCHCEFRGRGSSIDPYYICNDCYCEEVLENEKGETLRIRTFGNPGPKDRVIVYEYGDHYIDIEKINKRGRPKKTNVIKCNFENLKERSFYV